MILNQPELLWQKHLGQFCFAIIIHYKFRLFMLCLGSICMSDFGQGFPFHTFLDIKHIKSHKITQGIIPMILFSRKVYKTESFFRFEQSLNLPVNKTDLVVFYWKAYPDYWFNCSNVHMTFRFFPLESGLLIFIFLEIYLFL